MKRSITFSFQTAGMKHILVITLTFFAATAVAQTKNTITVIDFVKIKNNKRAETFFFYENNWKAYRDIALKKNYIKSYRLLSSPADSVSNFDLLLITEYTDSVQYRLSEERFEQIIKATRPNGPKLLNDLKPNDFRQNVFFKETKTIFSSL